MINLKNITLRNFLSIGQVTQAVNFDSKELTLILGENLDLGGDGARNGTGKTTLIQGLSYAMFGTPINQIRKDNLINRTNGKGMLVTLEISANGVDYKIERGRRPNILKFYVDNKEEECVNDAQGENKETQEHIERAIGMTPDMFKQTVALNTYSEPFLAMKANDQRNIIEQLLGITLLSEKAELIKSLIKTTKDGITEEEFRVKAVEEANKRVQEQIENLKRRANLWDTKHADDLKKLKEDLEELQKLDIEKELQGHKDLSTYNQKKKDIADLDKSITRTADDIEKEEKALKKVEKELAQLKEHKCHTCGQDFHDEKHAKVTKEKENTKKEN
jgi:DNA repair exonuclease SbcCD ATPase subunit